jgi:hypothetical protein
LKLQAVLSLNRRLRAALRHPYSGCLRIAPNAASAGRRARAIATPSLSVQ